MGLSKRSRQVVTGTILIAGLLGGLGLIHQPVAIVTGGAAVTRRWALTAVTENEVCVDIAVERDPSSQVWLMATFTPLRAHFHLYGKDLPKMGIGGQGRPTLLEIVMSGPIQSIGSLLADQPTFDHYSRVIQQSLPVYPEGPVTLRTLIDLPNNRMSTPAELSLTYMACSEDTCLTPVVDRHVSVMIPNEP